MQVSFLVDNVKPCSINRGYYKTRKVMTKEGRRYRKRLLLTINQSLNLQHQLNMFRHTFDPHVHGIKVYYTFLVPEQKMYTNKGPISMASGDVDNYIKLTTDFLFNDKYLGHKFPGHEEKHILNFGVDDRFIVETRATKMVSPSNNWGIGVKVKLCSLKHTLPSFTNTVAYSD